MRSYGDRKPSGERSRKHNAPTASEAGPLVLRNDSTSRYIFSDKQDGRIRSAETNRQEGKKCTSCHPEDGLFPY